jgi:hypothetical protein
MCLLLCSNPKVHEWLNLPQALAYRESFQLGNQIRTDGTFPESQRDDRDTATAPKSVMKRSAWWQLYFRHLAEAEEPAPVRSELSKERHPTLEAITRTWDWLLALVGWRC